MADGTKIEWTDATWSIITGCSVVSPGCTHCYAMRLAGTRLAHTPSRAGLTKPSKAGPVWTGEVRLNEQWLDQPLRWRRPRRIFVCAHGDLFHEAVPDEWIDRVFAVMALAPQHTFQVLTKRADRMRHYVRFLCNRDDLVADAAHALDPRPGRLAIMRKVRDPGTPLPNVWLGVSAEDQERADQRIPELLATPAAVRFVSAEPLLGPIDLMRLPVPDSAAGRFAGHGYTFNALQHEDDLKLFNAEHHLNWVIVGGESGPGARMMDPAWARSLRDQCKAASVSFFMKQMTKKAPIPGDLLVREMP